MTWKLQFDEHLEHDWTGCKVSRENMSPLFMFSNVNKSMRDKIPQ